MAQNNENTEQSCASVTLCSGGCGFFGNPQFDGMCSKCYKDALKRKQATNPPTPQEPAGRNSPLSAAARNFLTNSLGKLLTSCYCCKATTGLTHIETLVGIYTVLV